MILRSVTKHVRDQNWFAVFLDFLIVVIGVFIGIQVSNWNEHRVERDLEQRYLERLLVAVSQDLAEYEDAVRLAENRRERAQFVLEALEDPGIARGQPAELVASVLTAGFTYHPRIADAVFREMVATGNSRIIQDEALRDAIGNYYSAIENRGQWSYIRENTQLQYMERMAGVFTPGQYRRVWSEEDSSGFTPAEAAGLVDRMKSRPDFVEWLPYVESWQVTQRNLYTELATTASDLRGRIEAALPVAATAAEAESLAPEQDPSA